MQLFLFRLLTCLDYLELNRVIHTHFDSVAPHVWRFFSYNATRGAILWTVTPRASSGGGLSMMMMMSCCCCSSSFCCCCCCCCCVLCDFDFGSFFPLLASFRFFFSRLDLLTYFSFIFFHFSILPPNPTSSSHSASLYRGGLWQRTARA
jgi:hypothetical protein